MVITFRSPSQKEFDAFLSNFDSILRSIQNHRSSFTVVLGDLVRYETFGVLAAK